jgi:hypothetical protein
MRDPFRQWDGGDRAGQQQPFKTVAYHCLPRLPASVSEERSPVFEYSEPDADRMITSNAVPNGAAFAGRAPPASAVWLPEVAPVPSARTSPGCRGASNARRQWIPIGLDGLSQQVEERERLLVGQVELHLRI